MKPPIPDPFEIAQPAKKIEPQPVRWDEREKCFYVVYNANLLGRLRFIPKHFILTPIQLPLLFGFSPMTFGLVSGLNLSLITHIGFAVALSSIGMLLFIAATFVMSKPTLPSTVKLTAQGIIDEMPNKTIQLEWKKITKLKSWNGDFLFYESFSKGCNFYRENFSSRAEGNKFFEIANRLWQSNGIDWDEVVRQYATN